MDISSGIVKFGETCPGPIMERLRQENPTGVRRIKKLEMSYSTGSSVWACRVGCGEPSVMVQFLEAMEALEDLQIHNYHPNFEVLWPAIFRHGPNFKRLAIHSLPEYAGDPGAVWTVEVVKRVANEMPLLTSFEMDVDHETGAAAVEQIAPGSVLDEVAKMNRLDFARINVVLPYEETVFAPYHYGKQGRHHNPHSAVAETLTKTVFDRFFHHNTDAVLRELEIRFCRRLLYDRGDSNSMSFAFRAVKKDDESTGQGSFEKEKQFAECTATGDTSWSGYALETSPEAMPLLEPLMRETIEREYGPSIYQVPHPLNF